jgi:cation diffusion facilitator CzcD-associated flavoprotein CzcO
MGKQIRTVIIGGGISGITQAIRLKSELGDRVHITVGVGTFAADSRSWRRRARRVVSGATLSGPRRVRPACIQS